MTKEPYREKRRSQRAFAVALLIYALGIFLFSTWSYNQQKSSLQTRFDENVVNTTHACREFIGTGRARQHIVDGSTNAPVYFQHQERFDRFAAESGLELLAVATRNPTNAYYLIASKPGLEGQNIQYGDPFPYPLERIVDKSIEALVNPSDATTVALCNQDYNRIAILRVADDEGPDFLFIAIKNYSLFDEHLSRLALKKTEEGIFLLLMAVPLVLFHNQTQKNVRQQLETLNAKLKKEIQNQADREDELRDAIVDLERFNAVTVGRESRIIELKSEVNELLAKLNEDERYNIDRLH